MVQNILEKKLPHTKYKVYIHYILDIITYSYSTYGKCYYYTHTHTHMCNTYRSYVCYICMTQCSDKLQKQLCVFPVCLPGSAEDGLSGLGGASDSGLCAADHRSGGGPALEGTGRETGPSVQTADGGL